MVPNGDVYQVDALIRQRPGISLDELRKALGPDVSRPLKRLEALGYIRRVKSSDRSISCSVIELLDTGRPQRTLAGSSFSGRAA